MRIGWIGGLTRNKAQLERIAARRGHRLEFHNGDMAGRGAADLRALTERVDFLVIVTEINSHGAVIMAKRAAQALGIGSLVLRHGGAARLSQLLDAFDARQGRLLAAG
ncbi:MAG: DUF2325 domain-containing protein [Byssovorax sp.]